MRTARLLSLGGAALFLGLALIGCFALSVEYDEAYNATVAKAVAAGEGYVTSYHRVVPYNPEITTGPTVLLPMAALIAGFGPTIWAPGLATWLVSAIALLLLAAGLPRALVAAGAPPLLAGVALWPFLGLIWLFGAMGFLSIGMGEAPAMLLLLLAVLPLGTALETGRLRDAALGGLCLGLGILTKLLVLLPALGLIGILALAALQRHGRRRAVLIAGTALAFSVLPTVLFLLLRLGHVDPAQEARFMNGAGAGFGGLGKGGSKFRAVVAERLAVNAGILWHWLGGAAGLGLAAAGLLGGLLVVRRHRAPPGAALRLLVLAGLPAGALVLLLWWLPLGNARLLRHGLPAIWIALFAVALLPALAPGRWRLLAALPLAGLAAWLGWTREARLAELPPGYHSRTFLAAETVGASARLALRPVPRQAEQREALAALQRFQAANPTVPLAGAAWWVPRELEYLLPRGGQFHDMLQTPPGPGGAALVISEAYWNWGGDPAFDRLRQSCPETVFRNRSYAIQLCRARPG
ncbi:MAG: hypothetical protein ACOYOH_18240 [Paracraurococcus sp.]